MTLATETSQQTVPSCKRKDSTLAYGERNQQHLCCTVRLGKKHMQYTTAHGHSKASRCLCVQCENQVKRTSVAMGQAHPVWKEEVTFKSVQITSDLQVSTPLTILSSWPLHATADGICPC